MLYQIYEAQRSLLEPFADMADAASKLYGNRHTLLGQMPMAQRVSAAYALFHRLGKDYEKPEFGIRKVDVDGVEVAIDERVELDMPFCQLLRFKRFSDDPATLEKLKGQPPVLIVAPEFQAPGPLRDWPRPCAAPPRRHRPPARGDRASRRTGGTGGTRWRERSWTCRHARRRIGPW